MFIKQFGLVAMICLYSGIAHSADTPPAAEPPRTTVDGPWHGSFFCAQVGVQAPRSAEFGFPVAAGIGETTAKMDQIGHLALKISFNEGQPAALSLKAESGESYLSQLDVATHLTSADGVLRWSGQWQLYTCTLALSRGPLPADVDVVAPNDPEGKTTTGSVSRGATFVAAPNDPEVRSPLTNAGDNSRTSGATRDAPAEDTTLLAARDGPWRGSFVCAPAGRPTAIGTGQRSADFALVMAEGSGATRTKLEQAGRLVLKVSFDETRSAALSFKAESGESSWSTLKVTKRVAFSDGALRWTGTWQGSSCALALAPEPLSNDAEVVASNEPRSKFAAASPPPGKSEAVASGEAKGKATTAAPPPSTSAVIVSNEPNDNTTITAPRPIKSEAVAPSAPKATPAPHEAAVMVAQNAPAAHSPPTRADDVSSRPPTARDPAAIEVAFWESVKDSRDPEEFRAYLRRYPTGAFADLAKIRMARLGGK
jgi:hypothetical protein